MKLLVFEDSPKKLESVKELVNLKLLTEFEFKIDMLIRQDDSFLDSDLMSGTYLLILIDDDLGNDISGNVIIEKIIETLDTTPELTKVHIVYYSAGTTVDDLKLKSAKFGNVKCVSFENLGDYIFKYVKNKMLSK